ncbi:MAG TPA: hypothetical protein VEL28_21545 [Candidatus Binatia bacterium]|nr:hypothetical protein [Candidatus Binatia bacterium]
MALSDEDIERYARQVVIPGIGASGQERLLQATVLVVGESIGVEQASLYLRAAGAAVTGDARKDLRAVVVAGASTLDASSRQAVLQSGLPACWYEITEGGFVAGVHPFAPMPDQGRARLAASPALLMHQAAACDAAATACAIIVGLPYCTGPHELDLQRHER